MLMHMGTHGPSTKQLHGLMLDRVQMPILDGSGQFWVEQFAAVGLNPAYKPDSEELVRKQSWRPNTPITVYDHDSFITLYPAGLYRRITAGVEPLDSPVIGATLKFQSSFISVSVFFVDIFSTEMLRLEGNCMYQSQLPQSEGRTIGFLT
jgi:UDP-3-O-acyl-N-acetylglucosamine deacetylase